MVKKQRLSSESKESSSEERITSIAISLAKMAAEARKDRKELTAALEELMVELQR